MAGHEKCRDCNGKGWVSTDNAQVEFCNCEHAFRLYAEENGWPNAVREFAGFLDEYNLTKEDWQAIAWAQMAESMAASA